MTYINEKYKDQKVGFEVEVSSLKFEEKNLKNKTEVAYLKNRATNTPFLKIVVEGVNGSDKPYVEIVSEPLNTRDDIKTFFELVNKMISPIYKGKKISLTDFLGAAGKSYKVDCKKDYELNCEATGGYANASNLHINLDVPFEKLNMLANSTLFPGEAHIKYQPLKYAYSLVKENFSGRTDSGTKLDTKPNTKPSKSDAKESVSYPKRINTLLMLFFYQNIVYMSNRLPIERVELDSGYLYKNYVEPIQKDASGREMFDVKKLKFDVLFKVSKADIIRLVLSKEESEFLIKEGKSPDQKSDKPEKLDYKKIKNEVTKIIDSCVTVKSQYDEKSICKILEDNAKSRQSKGSRYFYDEPRISGLFKPRKIAGQEEKTPPEYYIVAELRETNLNGKAKDVFEHGCNFEVKFADFAQEFYDFVA